MKAGTRKKTRGKNEEEVGDLVVGEYGEIVVLWRLW